MTKLLVKEGRFGPYVQLGTVDEDQKPKNASLLKGMTLEDTLRKSIEEIDGVFTYLVTTKDQQTDINWGKRQGANEYLVKPVTPAALLAKIKALLDG